MLGLFDQVKYKFVRRYANLADEIRRATTAFGNDVRNGNFPDESESY
jgi:3-methyl-2-oxobutanoate hydroxymethyltransferase